MKVEVEVWENQRYVVFKGWGDYRLPTDRQSWSTKKGDATARRESSLNPPGWDWDDTEWRIAPMDPAHPEGWYYAPDFALPTRFCSAKSSPLSLARRRQWVRCRRELTTGPVMPPARAGRYTTWCGVAFYGFAGAAPDVQRAEQQRQHEAFHRMCRLYPALAAACTPGGGAAPASAVADLGAAAAAAAAAADDDDDDDNVGGGGGGAAASGGGGGGGRGGAGGAGSSGNNGNGVTAAVPAPVLRYAHKYGVPQCLRGALWTLWAGAHRLRARVGDDDYFLRLSSRAAAVESAEISAATGTATGSPVYGACNAFRGGGAGGVSPPTAAAAVAAGGGGVVSSPSAGGFGGDSSSLAATLTSPKMLTTREEIAQDVARTAPRHPFFDGKGSHGARMLTNVLLSFALADAIDGTGAAAAATAAAAAEANAAANASSGNRSSTSAVKNGSMTSPLTAPRTASPAVPVVAAAAATGASSVDGVASDAAGSGSGGSAVGVVAAAEYHQAFSYIAALFLLNCGPEDSFWLMQSLLCNLLPRGYHDRYLLHVDLRIFSEILRDKFPAIDAHFNAKQIDPSVFASGWIQGIFCAHFPFSTAARLLDVLFAEGNSSILVRLLVAFVAHFAPRLLEQDGSCSLGQFANDWARNCFDVEPLVRLMRYDELTGRVLARRAELLRLQDGPPS